MTSKRMKKNVDRLSNLPEEIVALILSLMPTKFAVQTCILSKNWRYRWMFVHNLNFDDIFSLRKKDFVLEFVDRVLKLCKTSKVKFLSLKFATQSFPSSTLSKWISEAIRLNVCELDVRVREPDLPLNLSACKTLTKLRLYISPSMNPRFRSHSMDYRASLERLRCKSLWNSPSSLVNLPCLRTLNIVVHSKPFDYAFKLINGCSILENLCLKIKQRDSKEDYYFEIPTLKRLSLSILNSIPVTNKVVLNVPNLEYLFVNESGSSLFVMKDFPSLIEAKLVSKKVQKHRNLWVEHLKGVSGAKYLSLDIPYWRFMNYPLNSPMPEFPNLKWLDLTDHADHQLLPIPQILESCSILEHLCIKSKSIEVCWNEEPHFVPGCMLTNLKTIKLTTKGQEGDIQFLKFMLANSKVLKTLIVKFDASVPLNKKTAFCLNVTLLPKASMDCQIRFTGCSSLTFSPLPEFSNLKRLNLTGYVDPILLPISQLLESCPELEHLCINKPIGVCWNEEPQSIPGCLLMKLKTVKLTTLGHENDKQFLKFILANSKVLKMLTVKFNASFSLNKEVGFSLDVSSLPRASSDCEIRFAGITRKVIFGEDISDTPKI